MIEYITEREIKVSQLADELGLESSSMSLVVIERLPSRIIQVSDDSITFEQLKEVVDAHIPVVLPTIEEQLCDLVDFLMDVLIEQEIL